MSDKVENKSKKNTKKLIFWISITIIASLALFFVWKFFISSDMSGFFNGTTINGMDVSNLTSEQASNIISSALNQKRNEIEIELTYKDKSWKFVGDDFEVNSDILPIIETAYQYGRDGSYLQKLQTAKKIQDQGFNIDISYKYVLGGLDSKIDEIISQIDTPAIEPVVNFNPNTKNMFEVTEPINGTKVEREKLFEMIDEQFSISPKIKVEIPASPVVPQQSKEEAIKNTSLRSKFSTSYKSSISDRKSNIKLALSKFNGMIVEPDQEVSFNQITGPRTAENGYKKANVIVDGVFVEGTGGGVCQASTTLYNALIKSDIEILEVNKHSLPASYVPLAFDAMVSEGYSDLKFKNNTGSKIYIKAYGNDTDCFVEIYGKPFDAGVTVERRAEFIKVIPHPGDRIVIDTNGEYADKVMFKGEYYRLKYPREGYESEAWLDYFVNGEKVDSKLLRHEIYQAQEGIVIEGAEELGEGMSIPENDVTLISPQKTSGTKKENIINKISSTNPAEYNP